MGKKFVQILWPRRYEDVSAEGPGERLGPKTPLKDIVTPSTSALLFATDLHQRAFHSGVSARAMLKGSWKSND